MTANTDDAFDLLLEHLEKKGYDCESSRSMKRFIMPTGDFRNTKYILFKTGEFYFCAYDSFSAKASGGSTSTGLYGVIEGPTDLNWQMFPKTSWDFLFRAGRKKTGVDYLDKNFTVVSTKKWPVERWINNKTAGLLEKFGGTIKPFELSIKDDPLPMIAGLKGKKVIGLETNQWLCKERDIDFFLDYSIPIITRVTGKQESGD